MKLEVDKVVITGGQFRIVSGDSVRPGTLTVEVQYGLLGLDGSLMATGTATNVPLQGRRGVVLGEGTLKRFSDFFSSLESDIASSLEGNAGGGDDARNDLEKILAGTYDKPGVSVR